MNPEQAEKMKRKIREYDVLAGRQTILSEDGAKLRHSHKSMVEVYVGGIPLRMNNDDKSAVADLLIERFRSKLQSVNKELEEL